MGVKILHISVQLSCEEEKLVKKYADSHNISLSNLLRKAVFEKIEDKYDLSCFKKAIKEYKKDPVTYTLDEVESKLKLNTGQRKS